MDFNTKLSQVIQRTDIYQVSWMLRDQRCDLSVTQVQSIIAKLIGALTEQLELYYRREEATSVHDMFLSTSDIDLEGWMLLGMLVTHSTFNTQWLSATLAKVYFKSRDIFDNE